MYNETYEEYIRSILGYPTYVSNNDFNNNINNSYTSYTSQNSNFNNAMLEECYPEIYKIVYPMVNKACSNITGQVTRDNIEEMTEEIYRAIETDNEIELNINLRNEVTSKENRNKAETINSKKNLETIKSVNAEPEENRSFRNRNLRDLIKILIIRELLRRPNNRPGFPPPPRPIPPNRPPFPGGARPPIMPRGMIDNYDIYEY